jgi:cell division protein FtsI (penicillin-binding protein 3)
MVDGARSRHEMIEPSVRIEGAAKRSIEVGRARLVAVGAVFALCFVVLAGRLVDLTLIRQSPESGVSEGSVASLSRGDIVDRDGVLLATNLRTASLFANPQKILDTKEAVAGVLRVLPSIDADALRKKLTSKRQFVWVKRNLSPRQQDAINRIGIPGLGFLEEPKRVYPQGKLASHIIGYTDVDNKGLAGVEKTFDERLTADDGEPVVLSLDVRVQHVLGDELQRGTTEFSAIGAAGIVLDVHTGEVLGMASLPDFDPNQISESTAEQLFNRATLGVYEMGSTFKAFTLAAALQTETVRMQDGYDATKPIRVGRFTIRDDHGKGRWLSVPEIFMYSSNIGAAKMALDIGAERQQEFLGRLGLLTAPDIELPEVGSPMLPTPWREVSTMTVAFGHGIAVSPLQLASGFAALVNGGSKLRPTLAHRKPDEDIESKQVISARTSAQMRRLLRLVVESGTGTKAATDGYLVGGKTGTAEKAGAGGYKEKALISSFVGVFPITDPRYVVLVMLDEPKGNKSTFNFASGGWTAAPIVSRVISRIGPLLGVVPEDRAPSPLRKAAATQ